MLEKAGGALRAVDAYVRRFFSLIFFLVAIPFAWQVSRNIAAALRFEDALIVLRYARNIAEGHGFVYNLGERILGVTTPLHTLISTVFVLFSPENAPAIQNVAGVVFLVLEAWLAARIVQRTHAPVLGGLVAVLILTNLNFSYLYFGMETHFFAFLILLSFHLYSLKKETLAGLALGVAFLTRYDAALLALLIGLALLAEKKRLPLKLTAAFFVVVTPWLLFSLLYFHSIMPNALGAKQDYYPALGYIGFVFRYYQDYFENLAGVFIAGETLQSVAAWIFPAVCFAGCWSLIRAAREVVVLIAFAALQVLVYAVLGPDPGFYWHYYLLNPVLTILFMVGLYELLARGLRGLRVSEKIGRPVLTLATLVGLVLAVVNLFGGLGYKFQLDPHSRQLYTIAEWLNERYDDDTSLLQPSIGILGYETNMRMIDHAGLVTPGLYYYDSQDHTPMTEVLARFEPDLVLIPEGADEALPRHGYREVATFTEPATYLLYELSP